MPVDRDSRWIYPVARWWKCDLHTHTPASMDYGRGPRQATLREVSPRDWLLDYMRAGVDCVAVTDHNSGEWIDELKDALDGLRQEACSDYKPLHLFPGVEITTNGGIHVLAVLDPMRGLGMSRSCSARRGMAVGLGAATSRSGLLDSRIQDSAATVRRPAGTAFTRRDSQRDDRRGSCAPAVRTKRGRDQLLAKCPVRQIFRGSRRIESP